MQVVFRFLQLALLSASLLSIWLVYCVLRRYLSLRQIPGPRLAAWTDLWLMKQAWSGRNSNEMMATLDRKYGPLVRCGPRRVFFSDPSLVPKVYGTTKVFDKGPMYDVTIVKVKGNLIRSFANQRNEKVVTAIKRQIAFAFSSTAVSDYEHHINLTINAFKDNLRLQSSVVDMVPLLCFFTFDTICRLAFSDSLKKPSDSEAVIKVTRERFAYWHRWFAVPDLERLIFKNPFVAGAVGAPSAIAILARNIITARTEKKMDGERHDLLDRFLQAQQVDGQLFNMQLITGLVMSMIAAGSDTTSHTLANFFWNLCQNPQVYQRLKSEIRAGTFSSPPTLAETKKHPFIEACIKETLRMHAIVSIPLERVVPVPGLQIGDVWLPAGTIIAANQRALAFNTSVYGSDAHVYNPDRWLNASPSQLVAMERASFAFSQGKRNCIGMHIAWMELLKLTTAVIMDFDIELADPTSLREEETLGTTYCKRLDVKVTPRIDR